MAPSTDQRYDYAQLWKKSAAKYSHASELSRFVPFYDLRVKKGRHNLCRVQCC